MQNIYRHGEPFNKTFLASLITEAAKHKHIVIDGFCGMGGVTEGFEQHPDYFVLACINHWDKAIYTHAANHPNCLHLLEDFRLANLEILQYLISEIKKLNPNITVHGWFSLECTNFSNAKGGMSRDEDSRTLANSLHMKYDEVNKTHIVGDSYVQLLDFDVIWIENVKEFQLWGPMIAKVTAANAKGKKIAVVIPKGVDEQHYYQTMLNNGYTDIVCPLIINKKTNQLSAWYIPCPAEKGKDFEEWKAAICSHGYNVQARLLNCADYGIPQHRIRLIMQFQKIGKLISYPKPTHSKTGKANLPKWMAVGPCLDLNDEGESVLSFKTNKKGELLPRIKSPATIARLIKGCKRHVIGNREPEFIVKYNGNNATTGDNNGCGINEPSKTIARQQRLAIAKTHLVDYYFGNGFTKPINETANVMGTKDGAAMHTVNFLTHYYTPGTDSNIKEPNPTLRTKDCSTINSVQFIAQAYSGKDESKVPPITNPSRAVTCTGRLMCVHVKDRITPSGLTGRGYQTVDHLHIDAVLHYEKHGFGYMGMKTIVTDVVRENNQTYRLGWTEQCKDGSKMGVGMPEYLLIFRKDPTDTSNSYSDFPVEKAKPLQRKKDGSTQKFSKDDYGLPIIPGSGYSRSRWQIDAHGYTRSSGNRLMNPKELAEMDHSAIYQNFKEHSLNSIYEFEQHVKIAEDLEVMGKLPSGFMLLQPQSWSDEVWTDITRMLTLNGTQWSMGKEMHICPMQFDIADRVIAQMSNPGDVVFDPFSGLMTVPLRAMLLGRYGIGHELSTQYFLDGAAHLKAAEYKINIPSLFDCITTS